MDRYCCATLQQALTSTCDQHKRRGDCPDATLVLYKRAKAVGIPVRDGGASFIEIRFCPWCGRELKPQMKDW